MTSAVTLNKQPLSILSIFKYLGSIISNESSKPEVLARIAQDTATLLSTFKYLGSVISDESSKPKVLARLAQDTATLLSTFKYLGSVISDESSKTRSPCYNSSGHSNANIRL
ncbi:hypothetical protein PoB_005654900 [Plakobranchus ocellatus]|uniref:Uncharacterized protein n=1 Tax=Plakobranchus ocellatus TaxID=259542 RepID=A0AAV4CGY5_9GAST|nr:hypothetical protein PoB_005654900 [Plakobranchus ocellatus]